ncbi:class I SAM-dependent methyltransferase [Microbacterium terricola]|uniref:Methyltransferase n=1 Tax=Microbacterium terricola TaxID=344163 RepID=A0ABM8DZF2_9MICO|nr:class I SAM-dependent methyltransferase [Microbacterium terricola]UYK41176.1 class I SAM-dependent methyltransferase [Microbacterium terricola]BDV31053.1 putative methyltransferase [Microbacterium terricola]
MREGHEGTTSAASFDAVAEIYARSRPSYPQESVDWLLDGDPAVVVDVGAGTGLFTRLLRDGIRTVIAVEPSAPMREELRAAIPDVEAVQGAGERMPLRDASADLAVFAQAWHWVDVPAASAEVARVLRPGGRLGLVWNLRDERVEWVRALGVAMRADGDHFRGTVEDPGIGHPFGTPERSFVPWVRRCTQEEIIADVRSRSYFALLTAAQQDHVAAAVEAVLQAHALTSGGRVIELPYVTASYRYTRP